MRSAAIVILALASGCTPAAGRSLASLEAEVNRLRGEQERLAQQVETLQSRMILTEDAARLARNAAENAGRRQVIRLGVEPTPPETIRVDVSGSADDPGASDANAHAEPARLRITGTERIPERPSFVVRDNERLPLAPVPPTLAPVAPRPVRTEGVRNQHIPPAAVPATPTATLDTRAATAYDEALALVRADRCDQATEAFGAFLVRWPDHPHADNAMYWRGECYLRAGDLRRATTEFEGLAARFPLGNKLPDALYKLVTCYRRLGDRAAAARAERRLIDEFPGTDAARRVQTERQSP